MERKGWGNHGGSAQWHHWFITWYLVSFSEHLSEQRENKLGQNRKFIVKTDYRRIYTGVFSLFCPQSSLCLDLQQETTASPDYSQIYTLAVFAYLCWFKVQSCFWMPPRYFLTSKCLHFGDIKSTVPQLSVWGVQHDSKEIFFDSTIDVIHRMMNHAKTFMP